MIDTPSKPPIQSTAELHGDERRNHPQWDMGLHRNLTRLDIAQGTPPKDAAGAWASEANRAVQAQAEQARGTQPVVRFEQSSYSQPGPSTTYQHHQHTISAPPITPKEAKRHGWYHGPVSAQSITPNDSRRQRTSPEDSSSSEGGVPGTPSSASVTEYNPLIVHSSGWVEPSRPGAHMQDIRLPPSSAPNGYANYLPSSTESPYNHSPVSHSMAPAPPQQRQVSKADNNMLRLEALVAVATSEENVAAAAY